MPGDSLQEMNENAVGPALTEAQKRDILRQLSDYKDVMRTPQGRRLIYGILDFAGAYRNPFAGDANQTNFNCGLQAVGQFLISNLMQACPDQYQRMLQESLYDGEGQ